jgi:hypothetical protein
MKGAPEQVGLPAATRWLHVYEVHAELDVGCVMKCPGTTAVQGAAQP